MDKEECFEFLDELRESGRGEYVWRSFRHNGGVWIG